MAEDRDQEILEKLDRYQHWAMTLSIIAILGSCVAEIDNVGGGHDSHQKMAAVFFFHVFLIVPCLFGFLVYLRLKLEKYCLSKKTIDGLNESHMRYAEKEARRLFGPLNGFFKQKKKK